MPAFVSRCLRFLRMAVQSLLLHKLRAVLTMLGVVFGVGSVVAMLAIGEGASYEIREQLRKLGPDRILIRSVHPPETSGSHKYVLEYGVTEADLARIEKLVPGISAVAASYEMRKDVWAGHRAAQTQIVGTTPSFREIHHLHLQRGRFLADADLEDRANVTVLGASVARQLFGADDPIGQEFKHSSGHYRIVGILSPRPEASAAVSELDHSVFIPLTTAKLRLDRVIRLEGAGSKSYELVDIHQLAYRVDELEQVPQIASMVRRLLDQYHPQRDYQITVPYELLQQNERTKRTFSWVLGSIGGISLLVGGIGIMNIMLASVMERTREIGIRRALGAKRWDIILQFLMESMVLSTSGGIVGLGVGLGVPQLVTYLSELKTVVTPWSLVLSLVISVGVGVVFGVYPAQRAARMDPIEALRHE